MASGIGDGTGAGTGAVVSRSGVLNLTRGRTRDPPLLRTISDIKINCAKRGRLTEYAAGACISELKLFGKLLNLSETIKMTQGSLTATEMALNG